MSLPRLKNSSGPLDNQTWQKEWKNAPLTKVQLREDENQTGNFSYAGSCLYMELKGSLTTTPCNY